MTFPQLAHTHTRTHAQSQSNYADEMLRGQRTRV